MSFRKKITPEESATASEPQVRGDKFVLAEALRQISLRTWTGLPPPLPSKTPSP